MTKKKNGRIELLRFLFAIMILLFHIQKRFAENNVPIGHSNLRLFCNGYIGVEFFFLVSGYLLAASCFAKKDTECTHLGTETAKVMFKKIMSVFPYHLFATVLTIIVNSYFLEDSSTEKLKYVIDSWASIFMVQAFGFYSSWANKLTWYLDVWIMSTFIFYVFLRKNFDVFSKVVCPMLGLFILGYIDYRYGSLGGIDTWTGLLYKCFLRGFAEMSLGIAAFSMTRALNNYSFTAFGKWILAIVETLGYVGVFIYASMNCDNHYDFFVLFGMMILVILSFSEVNPGRMVFDSSVFSLLGKMSLLIYLNQFYAIRLVEMLMAKTPLVIKYLMCIVLTVIGALICDFVVRHISFKRIKGWFLVQ